MADSLTTLRESECNILNQAKTPTDLSACTKNMLLDGTFGRTCMNLQAYKIRRHEFVESPTFDILYELVRHKTPNNPLTYLNKQFIC